MPKKKSLEKTSKKENKILQRGIEAFAHGAWDGGLKYFFGARVENLQAFNHFLKENLPRAGGKFVQTESENSAIHMLYGAAAAGAIPLTVVDSPGFAKIQEGLSYLAAAELPSIILNIMRAGPGTGNLSPAQGDYFPAVKGGGHGHYHSIVLAPSSVQDMYDFGKLALYLAQKHCNPVIVLTDIAIAHMMEPVLTDKDNYINNATELKSCTITGCLNRPRHHLTTLEMNETNFEVRNYELFDKYRSIQNTFSKNELIEKSYSSRYTNDCDLLLVSYGILSRIAQTALEKARKRGYKVGLFSPNVLWPFPEKPLKNLARKAKHVLVCELSMGQMAEDIRRIVKKPEKVRLYGRTGGRIPSPFEVLNSIKSILDLKK
ncbi:transketolase C-terminal domain-containing protein [Candidatus Riflebacteria bacterium]